jgi:hypothetical protein
LDVTQIFFFVVVCCILHLLSSVLSISHSVIASPKSSGHGAAFGEAVISDMLTSLWVVMGCQSANRAPRVAVLATKLASEPVLDCLNVLPVEHVLV